MQRFFNRKLLISLAIILNVIALTSIFTRSVNVDEGMIAAHAYYYNEVGFVKSPHFHNAQFGWEERQFHYHKLTVWLGAGISKVFGFHLLTFRLISFVFYLLFLYFFYLFFKLKKLSLSYYWLSIIIFLTNCIVFGQAFVYRPEISVLTFGFISYFVLEKEKLKSSYLYICIAGVVAGLAMLMHLNGVIFIVAGTLTLLFNKKILKSFVFGLSATVTSMLYFLDVLNKVEFAQWKQHFFEDPNLIAKTAHPLIKVLDEHMRFFHSEAESIFSLLLIASLIVAFKQIRVQFKGMLGYLLLLIIGLAFIDHGPSNKYMLNYMPFLVIIIATAFHYFNTYSKALKGMLIFSAVLFFAFHPYKNIITLSHSYNVVKRNQEMAQELPEKNVLLYAHEGFVFDQISNYTIQSYCAFNFHHIKFHPGYTPTIDDLFDFLYEGQTEYVLIDRVVDYGNLYEEIPYKELEIGSQYYNYRVINKGEDFIIFKLSNKELTS